MIGNRKVYAVIGAAGAGTRMAASVPKQFLKIGGRTILEASVNAFLQSSVVDGIVITVPQAYTETAAVLFRAQEEAGALQIVRGGAQRQDSVQNGLNALKQAGVSEDSIILIHDGVRPYVSRDLILRTASAAAETGAAVPAVAPKDTIRLIDGKTLPRASLCCVQTPQGFIFGLIRKAFEKAYAENYYGTDDAGLVERLGEKVTVIPGETANIKITTPEDLQMESRIGTGFDVHRLTENRKLILGGVEIPFEKGLLGHSDADVLVHALMDAVLGAAALGDIGKLFPDSDPAYSGISSITLLERVRDAVADEGYCLGNADVTVVCQRPRLAPYIEQMRENIAEAFKVPKELISIKATTTEKLGFTGAGEGIAAEAVCLLNR